MNAAIVIVAYNRPRALKRLLHSLARARYDGFDSVPLIISIDGGGDPEVAKVARKFQWLFGRKKVYLQEENLGLRSHILRAGDYVFDYDGIIMLEDDLIVSPLFFRYGREALASYQNHDVIAGVSLYSYRYLDINGFYFFPSGGNGNTFLIKFPSSWGQAWTMNQWRQFRHWLSEQTEESLKKQDLRLPAKVASWPASSWKKDFARYLVDSGKYIVYPDTSLTTNMGEAGHHWAHNTLVFQVPLQFAPKKYRFSHPSQAVSYDQFFELEYRSIELLRASIDIPPDVEFDLYGKKPANLLEGKLIVSSKQPWSELRSYGMEILPHELNILYGIQGDEFHLGEGSEFDSDSPISRTGLIKHQTEFLGGRDLVKLLGRRLLEKIRGRKV